MQKKLALTKFQTTIVVIDFLVFGIIGYLIPLVGDDLNWWSSWGTHYFTSGTFLTYDGRYLGDLFIILMSHLPIISFLLYGICAVSLVILLKTITQVVWPAVDSTLIMLLCSLALLFLPPTVWQQIWGWRAGFANYVPSMIFPLFELTLILNRRHLPLTLAKKNQILLFFGALLSQFLAEHITLLNCCNVLLIYLLMRKVLTTAFMHNYIRPIAGGTFLGAILMFVNGAYLRILLGRDSYRSINHQQSNTLINYYKLMFEQHPHRVLLYLVGIIVFGLLCADNYHQLHNQQLLTVTALLIVEAIISQLPFLVISPYGPRCAFSWVLFSWLAVIINIVPWLNDTAHFTIGLLSCGLLIAGLTGVFFAENYHQTFVAARDLALYQRKQNSAQTYVLDYADVDFIWTNNNSQDHNFQVFFVKPKSQVIPVAYPVWKKLSQGLNLKQVVNQKKLLKRLQIDLKATP